MATAKKYNQDKQESGEVTLSPEIFEIEPRAEILNFVVRSQMAAKRSGTHSVKTRAFVSGGGSKPWKQKGTGRARAGSNRSPVWRGGAIIFGPVQRDYGFKVNKKVRNLAMRMALSSRFSENELLILDKIELEKPKTKFFAKVASTLELKNALVVLPENDDFLMRAGNNYPNVVLTTPEQLSVWQILKYRQLVVLEDALEKIEQRFADRKES